MKLKEKLEIVKSWLIVFEEKIDLLKSLSQQIIMIQLKIFIQL